MIDPISHLRHPKSGRYDAKRIAKLYHEPLSKFAAALNVPIEKLGRHPDHRKFQPLLSSFADVAMIVPMLKRKRLFRAWLLAPNKSLKGDRPIDWMWFSPTSRLKLARIAREVVLGEPGEDTWVRSNDRVMWRWIYGLTPSARAYEKSLKQAEAGALSQTRLMKRIGVSEEELRRRRDSFTIVYWTNSQGRSWYPKWQFDGEFQVLPDVRRILRLLRTHDTLHVLATFLVPAIGDAGVSPLQLIREGRGADAVAFVRSLVDQR